MPEFPGPIRLPGEPPAPREPYETHGRHETPSVVDDDTDVYGAEDAAALLTERISQVEPGTARTAADGRILLSPTLAPGRDRIAGPVSRAATLVVFGAHGTPASRSLAAVLDEIRRTRLTRIGVAWRHYPDPAAHPSAAVLALAVEAAAVAGRFWTLTRELLHMRHHEPGDLHSAMIRSALDPEQTLAAMRRGVGSDRILTDVESALASGVTFAPTLFIDGERYDGALRPRDVIAAVDAAAGAA